MVLVLWIIAKYIFCFAEKGSEEDLSLRGIFKVEDLRELKCKDIFCDFVEKEVYIRDLVDIRVKKAGCLEREMDLREEGVIGNDYLVDDQLGLVRVLTAKLPESIFD